MGTFQKLRLLVWKNCLLQWRHKYQTFFEIVSPVIFSLLIIFIRCLVEPKSKPEMTYQPFLPTYYNFSERLKGNMSSVKNEGTLAFSPEGTLPRKAMQDAMEIVAVDNLGGFLAFLFNPTLLPKPKGYKNANAMETELTKPNAMKTILCAVQFEDDMANATAWPNDVVVTIRFPATMRTPMMENPIRLSWRTNLLFPLFPRSHPRDPDDIYGGKAPGYSPEMFLGVQHAVSFSILKEKLGRKSVDMKVYLQRFPQPAYRDDTLLLALDKFISMIIMLCFAYSFVNTVKVVTAEKELQLKDTMTVMGLSSWIHWLAWFIKQFSFLLISVVCIVILFKIPFQSTADGEKVAVLTFTPWSVLFFLLLLFMIASISFSFMVSVFFSRASTAASFMGLAWFATYSVYMLSQVIYEEVSFGVKIALCLISNTAMGFVFQMLVVCEGTSTGLQWGDFFVPISYHDEFVPGHVVTMLFVDTGLYLLIAMYVEKVRPGTYGVPLPWYFPFTKSFWMPRKIKVSDYETTHRASDSEYRDALLKIVHDEEPQGVPMRVNLQNLTKIYKGTKRVVDNLNLRMYENEITVLLGHNGAGKTTTISMLTGTIPPTSGTAIINGYNVATETSRARKSLGICPQHNVLFPDLTVKEHLIFYSKLKGVTADKLKGEVEHFLDLLQLQDKKDVLSSKLSGGQKRRLSVGAAMCGSSRVVLLDEPTSGLDPAARRALWDLLLKEKKGRTMILTTHFMDEAEILGDRIAIMAGGKLQCVGTPYFLKKHYGIGYKLTIVKMSNCPVNEIASFLAQHITNLKENSNIGTELTYILPSENVSKFPNMLKELEEKKEILRISSYGLSVTSLEEVFMKAGAELHVVSSNSEISQKKGKKDKDVTILAKNQAELYPETGLIQKETGFKLFTNHLKAMFLKLAYNSMRNKLSAFIQFVSPVFNIVISVVIARSWHFITSLPPLTLSLESGFRKTQTLFSHNGTLRPVVNATMESYKQYFESSKYPGMTYKDLGTEDIGKHYLMLTQEKPLGVKYENVIGATFTPNTIIAWFSNYGYHDSAISLAHVNEAISRALLPGSSLKIINHPFPYSVENLLRVMASGGTMIFQFAFNMGFVMAFVSSFVVLFVIKERVSGAKLLQRVAGVRPAVMWVSSLVWDWTWLFLIYVVIIITLASFQELTLSTPTELGRVMMVLMVFSLAIIPVHYLASLCFEASATGFAKMCFMNIFTGSMPFLITEVLRLKEVGSSFYANIFDWIFAVMPLYCLSRSLRDMSEVAFGILACDTLCLQFPGILNCSRPVLCETFNISVCCTEDDPYFKWNEPGIGRYIFMMCFVGIVSFALLLIIEYNVFRKYICTDSRPLPPLGDRSDEDSDVRIEREMVETRPLVGRSLVCRDLTKFYRKFMAVHRLSFAVRRAECFGLLGINGAGKTTTFRMLTGDETISCGDAFVHAHSVRRDLQSVYRLIGYCPQFDALLDNLTARENLRIFCLLRGIPTRVGAERAAHYASTLGFLKHFDKKVSECSGGTKRKISTAVALMGDSPLVFLDEPTTGMDPASKRLVWSSISEAVGSGRSVVLTSHSMEECEALCSRLTVMVGGRLHCLGSLQHLKSKFSQGYTLIVKCKAGPQRDADVENVNTHITKTFRDAKLMESYLGISTYYLSDTDLPWWKIFHTMEEMRAVLTFEDYSVTQTTLEQVFLRFTKLQPGLDT